MSSNYPKLQQQLHLLQYIRDGYESWIYYQNEFDQQLLIGEAFGCDIGNKIWQWYLVGKRCNTRLMKWYESYEVNIVSGEFEHKVLYKIYLKYTKMSQ